MQKVHLIRYKTSAQGTFGVLLIDGLYYFTVELPYRDNKPNISCIPTGEYTVKERFSPHFKRNLYEVQNVKHRSFILIHVANFGGDVDKGYQTNLQGCIGLGKQTGTITNKYGKKQECVLNSSIAVYDFMDYMEHKDFTLKIMEIM